MTTGSRRAAPRPPAATWPWQRSLQYRIIFAYGAVFVAVLLLLSIWIGQVIYQASVDAAVHDLEVVAFLAANALEDPLSGYREEFDEYKAWEQEQERREDENEDHSTAEDHETDGAALLDAAARQEQAILLPRLQQVAVAYAGDTGAHITIFDHNGNPLANSHHPLDLVPDLSRSAEFQTAPADVKQTAVRPDSSTGVSTLFAVAPIVQGDQILGVVQIGKSLTDVTASARQLLLNLAIAELTALILATLLAVWIGRRLVRPLRDLEQAAIAVAGGDLGHTVAVQRADEIGALASAFNYMVSEVRSLLEQQRNFVASASHELRTPLTNIKLRSEAVRTLYREDPELAARYMAEIDSEADRLARLANELLELTRLEAGSTPQQPAAAVDIAPLLHETVAIMQLHATAAHVTLSAEAPPSLMLRIHAEQIEAVIVNLLDNAIKYTPAGGSVRLTTALAGGRTELRIADSGPGIPPEDLPHIFERFYRVDKARSRRWSGPNGAGSGAGLGLSIAKEIVERNGGRIVWEPAPVHGSVFVVSFPTVA